MSGWHQLSAGQHSSPSPTPLRWWSWGSPDSLIGQPAGVALVEAVLIGGLQLLGRGDDGTVLQAGPLRPVKVQGVARGDGTGEREGRSAQPPLIQAFIDSGRA